MMMQPKFDQDTGQDLARIIHRVRPDWDVRGVLAQLGTAAGRHGAGATLTAALRAASDRDARTPGAILFEKYWTPDIAMTEHDAGYRRCCECFTKHPVQDLTRTEHGWECGCTNQPERTQP